MMFTRRNGLHCVPGDFCIDPVRATHTAVITHGHSDHARRGMQHYIAHKHTALILRHRLGTHIKITELEYGQQIKLGEAWVSLHPAGHVIGSAQVRVEHKNEVWVITGDFKREPDAVSAPFEVVQCNTFVTECTFGLPIYQWPDMQLVMREIHEWWQQNIALGRTSVINVYPLGKAQRLLCELDQTIGTVYVDDSIHATNQVVRNAGVLLKASLRLPVTEPDALVLTSARGYSIDLHGPNARLAHATASGWNVSQKRMGKSGVRGFVVSDHADWPTLLRTVHDVKASHVIAMHGDSSAFVKFLREQQIDAHDINDILSS